MLAPKLRASPDAFPKARFSDDASPMISTWIFLAISVAPYEVPHGAEEVEPKLGKLLRPRGERREVVADPGPPQKLRLNFSRPEAGCFVMLLR
jgi:hypothetical protein